MFDGDFELISGKYIVDAKSILGLFSVDLSKPVTLRIDVNDSKMNEVLTVIEKYKAERLLNIKSKKPDSLLLLGF